MGRKRKISTTTCEPDKSIDDEMLGKNWNGSKTKLTRNFIKDCFSEIELCTNLHLLNVCQEWSNIMFETHRTIDTYQDCIKGGEIIINNDEIEKHAQRGILNTRTLAVEFDPLQSDSLKYKKNPDSTSWLIVATGVDNRIILAVDHKSCFSSNFCEIIAIDYESTLKKDTNIILYLFDKDEEDFTSRKPQTVQRIDDILGTLAIRDCDMMNIKKTNGYKIFNDCLLPSTYQNVYVHNSQGFYILDNRLSDLLAIKEGYSIVSSKYHIVKQDKPNKRKSIEKLPPSITSQAYTNSHTFSVKLHVPKKKEMDLLPLWYLPEQFRIPNSVVVVTKKNELYNIPLKDVDYIGSKSKSIPYYSIGKDIIMVGFSIVLYVSGFILGKIVSTEEHCYTMKTENNMLLSLSYETGPEFKIFETFSNAKRWQLSKISNLEKSFSILKPGDLIMNQFINLVQRNGQSYSCIVQIKNIYPKLENEKLVDYKDINSYIVLNGIDESEELPSKSMENSTEKILSSPSGIKKLEKKYTNHYYINNDVFLLKEDIQDVIIIPEADTIKLFGAELFLNDNVSISGPQGVTSIEILTLERIIHNAIVLSGKVYQIDSIRELKRHVKMNVERDSDFTSTLDTFKYSNNFRVSKKVAPLYTQEIKKKPLFKKISKGPSLTEKPKSKKPKPIPSQPESKKFDIESDDTYDPDVWVVKKRKTQNH